MVYPLHSPVLSQSLVTAYSRAAHLSASTPTLLAEPLPVVTGFITPTTPFHHCASYSLKFETSAPMMCEWKHGGSGFVELLCERDGAAVST
jgi:hypothetical protein